MSIKDIVLRYSFQGEWHKACIWVLLFFTGVMWVRPTFAKIVHCYFIVNPTSNQGQAGQDWDNHVFPLLNDFFVPQGGLNQATAVNGVTFEVAKTEYAGHGTALAEAAFKDWQQNHVDQNDQLLIVAVGGDGTVHEVVQPLPGNHQVVFGILPTGSGNDLARTLGLVGLSWQELLEILVNGEQIEAGAYEIEADLLGNPGQTEKVYAIDEFDIGLSADASRRKRLHDTGERPQRLLSISPRSAVYPAALLSSAATWRSPMLYWSIDNGDCSSVRGGAVLASTGPTLGRSRLLPGMRTENQQGQCISSHHLWGVCIFLQMLAQLIVGSGMNQQAFTEMTVAHHQENPPQPVQIDGDVNWQTPLKSRWVPGMFRFMGPRKD